MRLVHTLTDNANSKVRMSSQPLVTIHREVWPFMLAKHMHIQYRTVHTQALSAKTIYTCSHEPMKLTIYWKNQNLV